MLVPMSTKAVLFDLDGTLADTVDLIAEHLSGIMTEFGVPVEPSSVIPYIGRPLEVTIAALSGYPEADERHAQMFETYHSRWYPRVEEQGADLLIPGVGEMLSVLRCAGYRIGVVTAKTTPEAEHLLEAIGVRDAVDLVVGTEMVERGKPAPDSALLCLVLSGAEAASTWYIGDAASDMEMASAARMRGMGITTGAASREQLESAGAEVVVATPAEVVKLVLG